MIKMKEFEQVFGVKNWLAISQNGAFEVCSAIFQTKNNHKLYVYYDHTISKYITENVK